MRELTLKFDGSCWPNPNGTAAYGYIIEENNVRVKQGHGVISVGPLTSNNYAEFHALYQGLRGCASLIKVGETAHINAIGDSDLVIKIMNGRFKATSNKLYYSEYKKAYKLSKALIEHSVTISFSWVPREQNQAADDLSKAHEAK